MYGRAVWALGFSCGFATCRSRSLSCPPAHLPHAHRSSLACHRCSGQQAIAPLAVGAARWHSPYLGLPCSICMASLLCRLPTQKAPIVSSCRSARSIGRALPRQKALGQASGKGVRPLLLVRDAYRKLRGHTLASGLPSQLKPHSVVRCLGACGRAHIW